MLRRLAPLLTAGLVLAACGSGGSDDVPVASGPAPTGVPTPTSGTESGGSAVVAADAPEALRFSAPLIGGGDIELATLAGRPVLLWFWAPW